MSKAQEKEKAMEYLREHNLEVVLNGFVNRVARERPQDPILTLEHSLSAEATKRRGIVSVHAEPYSINGFMFSVQVTLKTHMSTRVCVSPVEPAGRFREVASLLTYENAAKAAAVVNDKISEAIIGIDPQEQERVDKSIEEVSSRFAEEVGHFNVGMAISFALLLCGRDIASTPLTDYLQNKFMLKTPQDSFSTLLLPMISPSTSAEGPVMLSRAVGTEINISDCTNLSLTLASLSRELMDALSTRDMLVRDVDSFGTAAPNIPVSEQFGVERVDGSAAKKKGGKKGKGDGGDASPAIAITENGLKCIHSLVEKLGIGQTFALCKSPDLLISKENLQEEEEQGGAAKDKKKGGGKGKGASAADFADDAVLYDFNARVNFPADPENPPARDVHMASDIVDGYSRVTREVPSFASLIDPLSSNDAESWETLVSPQEGVDGGASPRRGLKSFITCTPELPHTDAAGKAPMLSFGHFSTITSFVAAVQTQLESSPKIGMCALSVAPLDESVADIVCALGIETAMVPGLLRDDVFRIAQRFQELSGNKSQGSAEFVEEQKEGQEEQQ